MLPIGKCIGKILKRLYQAISALLQVFISNVCLLKMQALFFSPFLVIKQHGQATFTPLLPRIKGRAIWQFDVEREVQVQHLPVGMAKRLLPKVPLTKPANIEFAADGMV